MSVLIVVFLVAIIAYGSQPLEFKLREESRHLLTDVPNGLICYECEDEEDEWGMNACRDPSRFDDQQCVNSQNVCLDWVHKGLKRMKKGCWNDQDKVEESPEIVWEMCNTTLCNKKTLTDYHPQYDPEPER